MQFGEYIRNKRLSCRIGLREFCMTNGLDPSYWSKVERDVAPAPKRGKVEEIVNMLQMCCKSRIEAHALAMWSHYFGAGTGIVDTKELKFLVSAIKDEVAQ